MSSENIVLTGDTGLDDSENTDTNKVCQNDNCLSVDNEVHIPTGGMMPEFFTLTQAAEKVEAFIEEKTSPKEIMALVSTGKVNVQPQKKRNRILFSTEDVMELTRYYLAARLPASCNVYDGLTDEQITIVEECALDRSRSSRPIE